MEKDKTYQKLLKKILIIENIGEIFYKSLISKTKHNNLKLIYERLALNERENAKCIEREILKMDNAQRISVSCVVLSLTRIVCGVLTARQLAWVLKSTLNRRIYSRWYDKYKDNNRDFWQLLLNHENLQHELLRPFWNN